MHDLALPRSVEVPSRAEVAQRLRYNWRAWWLPSSGHGDACRLVVALEVGLEVGSEMTVRGHLPPMQGGTPPP
jgi:hypothetical protein